MNTAQLTKHHRVPVLAGAALSLLLILVHLFLPAETGTEFASMVMVIIGAVYLGFAAKSENIRGAVTEAVTGVLFTLAGAMGIWISIWFVIGALITHGVWDLLHHRTSDSLVEVPSWYIPFCIVVDWVFALYLFAVTV